MKTYYKTGKPSHKKGCGWSTKRGRRKGTATGTTTRIKHFTALDAGRCVAYCRHSGADDALLARYLIYAFGLGNIPCILSRIILISVNFILIGALGKFLRGLMYIVRGVYLANTTAVLSEVSLFWDGFVTFVYDALGINLPSLTAAQWYIYIGSIQSGISACILFLDSFKSTIIYYRFIDIVCSISLPDKPFPIIPKPIYKGKKDG